LKQTNKVINIFEAKIKAFATGLFAFDNAPGHQGKLLMVYCEGDTATKPL